MSVRSIKLAYGDDVRRFPVDDMKDFTFDDLQSLAFLSFPGLEEAHFQYVDEDDDLITLKSDDELQEAFLVAGSESKRALRVRVVEASQTSFSNESQEGRFGPSSSSNPSHGTNGLSDVFGQLLSALGNPEELSKTMEAFQEASSSCPSHQQLLSALAGSLQGNGLDYVSSGFQMRPSSSFERDTSGKEEEGEEEVVHERVICDGCGMNPIVGIRYKCAVRQDFDLCEACEKKPEISLNHPMIKIRDPSQAPHTIITVLPEEEDHHQQNQQQQQHHQGPSWGGWNRRRGRQRGCRRFRNCWKDASTKQSDKWNQAFVSKEDQMLDEVIRQSMNMASLSPSSSYSFEEHQEDPKPMARFVSDVTFPDSSEVDANQDFTKIWRVRNDGQVDWPEDIKLVNVGGDDFGVTETDVKEKACVDEEVNLSLTLKAPSTEGRYVGYWRLATGEGRKFGQRFWADIRVKEPREEEEEEEEEEEVEEVNEWEVVSEGRNSEKEQEEKEGEEPASKEEEQEEEELSVFERELALLAEMGFPQEVSLPLLESAFKDDGSGLYLLSKEERETAMQKIAIELLGMSM